MNEKTFILRPDGYREIADRAYLFMLEKAEQHPLEVVIKPFKRRRNLDQNALYWAVLTDISNQVTDENGKKYSPEVWHEYFKALFLGKDTVLVDGEATLIPKSTRNLNVMEFADYVTQIQAWSVDHEVRLSM